MPVTMFALSEEDYYRDQERMAKLEKKIAFLEAALSENSDLIDSREAKRLTGIKDNRTLKKRFAAVEDAGQYKFKRSDIIQWRFDQGLHKAPELRISA